MNRILIVAVFIFSTCSTSAIAAPYDVDVEACFDLGITYEVSIFCLNDLLEKHPDNKWVLYCRGLAHKRNEFYDKALVDLNRAIEVEPIFLEAVELRAELKQLAGDEQGAILDRQLAQQIKDSGKDHTLIDMTRAIESDPKALLKRARYKIATNKDFTGAIADYDAYFQITGKRGKFHGFDAKARAQMAAGDLQGAVDTYTECIQINADNPKARAYEWRAIAKKKMGDIEGYEQDMALKQEAIRLDRQKEDERYTRVIAKHPDNPKLYFERAQLRKDLGDWEGVLADAAKALELFPPDYYQPHVVMCQDLKEEAEKEVSYIGKTPEEVFCMKNQKRMNTVNSMLESSSTNHRARRTRAKLRWGCGDHQGAIEDIYVALELKPEKENYIENAVLLRESADAMLSEDASRHLIWWARAKLKWLLKDYQGALVDIQQAVQLQPGNTLYQETQTQMQTDYEALQSASTDP